MVEDLLLVGRRRIGTGAFGGIGDRLPAALVALAVDNRDGHFADPVAVYRQCR